MVALSAVATEAARRYSIRRRLLDQPGERRMHASATPRGGGVGPVVALLVGVPVFAATSGADLRQALLSILGLAAVAGIGWWDDHRPLAARTRLMVHVVAGAILAHALGFWSENPPAGMATVALTTVLVNVWNFMDGINGIATLQALLVASGAAVFLEGTAAGVAVLAAGACLAFVPFNFPTARMFLGDVGSGALGYLIALLIALSYMSGSSNALLILFAPAAFLVDASLTLLRRVVRREQWWLPHTQHLFQASARRWGHTPVTLAYAGACVAGITTAWTLRHQEAAFIFTSLCVWYTAFAVLWTVLQHFAGGRGAIPEKDG